MHYTTHFYSIICVLCLCHHNLLKVLIILYIIIWTWSNLINNLSVYVPLSVIFSTFSVLLPSYSVIFHPSLYYIHVLCTNKHSYFYRLCLCNIVTMSVLFSSFSAWSYNHSQCCCPILCLILITPLPPPSRCNRKVPLPKLPLHLPRFCRGWTEDTDILNLQLSNLLDLLFATPAY
jgi:hypothetical protein